MTHSINAELEARVEALSKRVEVLEGSHFSFPSIKNKNTADIARFVTDAVCHMFGVSKDQVMSTGRLEKFVWPRQVAIYLVHKTAMCPLQEVGKLFNKHHGTVMHARGHVTARMETEPYVKSQIDRLEAAIAAQFPPQ